MTERRTSKEIDIIALYIDYKMKLHISQILHERSDNHDKTTIHIKQ